MKQNRFTEMIAVIVCFWATVPLVYATPTILWEDFDDGSGTAAFDPSFVHTFGPHPERGSEYLDWQFNGESIGNSFLIVGFDTQDYITFILEPGQYVSHVSVSHFSDTTESISFIGQQGRQDFELSGGYIEPVWMLLEMDMSTIGPIEAISLSGGAFDDIRITVVPEPVTWLLFLVGMVVILCIQNHRAFKSTGTIYCRKIWCKIITTRRI